MTDEEMAETYFESECLHSYADTEEELKEDVVTAFLAGLKAGRPQWHKAKDELPKIDTNYWSNDLIFLTKDCVGNITKHFGYFLSIKEFEEYNTCHRFTPDKVIAWCEIPTFDKE